MHERFTVVRLMYASGYLCLNNQLHTQQLRKANTHLCECIFHGLHLVSDIYMYGKEKYQRVRYTAV